MESPESAQRLSLALLATLCRLPAKILQLDVLDYAG